MEFRSDVKLRGLLQNDAGFAYEGIGFLGRVKSD